jgi:putative ABC transport system permease protein
MTLVGSARSVVVAIVSIVVAVSGITVFNTLLAGVVERTREFALMRAVGASQRQVFALLIGEALLLTLAGLTCGILLAIAAGPYIHHVAKMWIPFAPVRTLSGISAEVFMKGFGAALCAGLLAALYPALLASRMRPAIATKAS